MTQITPTSALTTMPDSFYAGTTVKYTRTDGNYPANSGWALTLYFVGAAIAMNPIAGVASGPDFIVTLPADKTKDLAAGDYQWREVVTKSPEGSFVSGAGIVTVLQNLAAAGAGDTDPLDVKLLALVSERLQGRLTDDMERYQIGGRTIDRIPFKDLYRIRDDLEKRVKALRNPGQFGIDVVVTPRDV